MIQLLKASDIMHDTYAWAYGVNSMGYRCPEFDTISWNDSVLLFGCSHVFGIGVEDKDTIAYQIQLVLKRPVINLGQGGTGYSYQWINSTILRSCGINPKAVVYLWPDISRQAIFNIKNDYVITKAMGHWSVDPKSDRTDVGIALVTNENHTTAMSYYYSKNVEVIWNCPVFQFSYTGLLPHSNIKPITTWDRVDTAPGESMHPGPGTNKLRANCIIKHLIWSRVRFHDSPQILLLGS